jgi:inhibitor of cysteine peptidase
MKNVVLMSLVFWVCLGLASVKGSKAQDSGIPSFNDPSQPIDIAVGQNFRIVLDANPTTGYQWQLSEVLDERTVILVGSEYDIPRTPGLVGAGGKQIWTFKAVGQGQTVIVLHYLRSWEKGVPPLKTVTFTVIVR